jgi:D-serine deaminase-like pyridoxal phosphate-dependent protein
MAANSFYLSSTKETLEKAFIGKLLKDVATPAAVLDLSKLKKNCDGMLAAADRLKFGWRAHIKTHKV